MNVSRSHVLLTVGLAATLPLSACSGGAGTTAEGAGGKDGGVAVATAFYPLAWVTEQVGGEHVTVTDLTPPGSNSHELELSPATVDSMSRGDLVVYLAGFQAAVDDAVATIGDAVPAYDVAADAQLQPAVGDHDHSHEHGEEGHDHEEEGHHQEEEGHHQEEEGHHQEEEGHHHEEEGHDHAGLAGMDPHFWLDPERLAAVALGVGEQLAKADPEHAEDYRANAETTAQELTDLGNEIAEGLQECSSSTIVVTHEAYGYLTEPHGIEMVGISGIDPDVEPSPARIAEIEAAATASDASTVFGEVAVDQKVADVVAAQTGLTVSVLDPLGSQVTADATYPGQMKQNLQNLRTALGCA